MQELIERLFGGKKKKDAAPTAGPNPDQAPEKSAAAGGAGLLDNTMIVADADLSEQIQQAAGNVFEDTLPENAALEDTAVGLPAATLDIPAAEFAPSAGQLVGLSAVQRCHIGKVRSRNEDSCFIFTAEFGGQEPLLPAGLYIVADGMGGHHAGHEASKNVARLVAQHILERIYLPLLRNSTAISSQPQEPIGEVIVDAVQTANRHIHNNDPKKSSGTTLTAALILGRRLYVAHVGDSRAYQCADGDLKLLTIDHSYVRRLQDAGQLTEEEAAVHPQRNMLYKAVGQGGDLDIDSFTRSLPRQGKLILCSDGLWGLVSDERISEVLNRDVPLGVMADDLLTMALNAGGHDNVTVIIVDFNY